MLTRPFLNFIFIVFYGDSLSFNCDCKYGLIKNNSLNKLITVNIALMVDE